MDRSRLRRYARTATGVGLTALGAAVPLWWLLGRLGDAAGSRFAGGAALLAALVTVAASAATTLAQEPTGDAT